MSHSSLDLRIRSHDLTLFDAIETQSSAGDRESWLVLQNWARNLTEGYAYLEIGSHLGGSLQQVIVDPMCRQLYSIDKRPTIQADDRGMDFEYKGNSTARMLANLNRVVSDPTERLLCFDADARDIDRGLIAIPPSLCFIDGEHSCSAAFSDFLFCLSVCSETAAIYFHDDIVIIEAIEKAMQELKRRRKKSTPVKLGGATFAIFLGDVRADLVAELGPLASNGYAFLRRKRMGRYSRYLPSFIARPLRRMGAALFTANRN